MTQADRRPTWSSAPTSRRQRILALVLGLAVVGGCHASPTEAPGVIAADAAATAAKEEEPNMWMTVGEHRFAITLADNATARAFAARFPLTLDMAELNGNEKHADLPEALPTDASRPGMVHAGDVMLYGSNTVVVFYESFRSSFSYTRLGRVDDPEELTRALGSGASRVTFSVKQVRNDR